MGEIPEDEVDSMHDFKKECTILDKIRKYNLSCTDEGWRILTPSATVEQAEDVVVQPPTLSIIEDIRKYNSMCSIGWQIALDEDRHDVGSTCVDDDEVDASSEEDNVGQITVEKVPVRSSHLGAWACSNCQTT